MNLHPDDIKEVLEKGWGERHPMAWSTGHKEGKGKESSLWSWLGWPVRSPVPETFTMVYAPRGEFSVHSFPSVMKAWWKFEFFLLTRL